MKTVRAIPVASFRDILAGHESVEISCPYKGEVVRVLTLKDDIVHMACPNGDAIDVPIDTPVEYEPWFMDRGSLKFDEKYKLCTEYDMVRYPDGTEGSVTNPDEPSAAEYAARA